MDMGIIIKTMGDLFRTMMTGETIRKGKARRKEGVRMPMLDKLPQVKIQRMPK